MLSDRLKRSQRRSFRIYVGVIPRYGGHKTGVLTLLYTTRAGAVHERLCQEVRRSRNLSQNGCVALVQMRHSDCRFGRIRALIESNAVSR